jgi:hypothetical protein
VRDDLEVILRATSRWNLETLAVSTDELQALGILAASWCDSCP